MKRSTVSDDMRDYPEVLRVNMAAVDLAVALHNSRSGVYGPQMSFRDLSPEARHWYVKCAERIIRALKPKRPSEGILPAELADAARQAFNVVPDGR